MSTIGDIVGKMTVQPQMRKRRQTKRMREPTASRDWKKIINTPNEFFVSTPQLSALRSAVLYTGTYVMVPIPYIGMYMMMDFTHTLIPAVGIGDHTGIIRIGDIPVMDGIHQDRLLDPV